MVAWYRQILLLLALLPEIILAEEQVVRDPANYAFANYLGSGIYKTAEQQVTVFKIPLSYSVDRSPERPFRIRLPVTVGFFDFKPTTVDDIEIPGEVGTFSFIPGIERDYFFQNKTTAYVQWILTPYIDLGWSKNFSNNKDVLIYSAGLTANRFFQGFGQQHLWSNKLWYAGFRALDEDDKDDFATLQSGVDLTMPWQLSAAVTDLRMTLYSSLAIYIKPIRFEEQSGEVERVHNSIELGFTFKSATLGERYLFSMEQLGLGMRYGEGIKLIRLVFGSPF